MFIFHEKIEKKDFAEDILLQDFARGKNLNVLHWNMADGSEVKLHTHPQEQFGYVIQGGFRMFIGNETKDIGAGDAYIIPSDVPHSFVALGQTEAIDIFSPVRELPEKK